VAEEEIKAEEERIEGFIRDDDDEGDPVLVDAVDRETEVIEGEIVSEETEPGEEEQPDEQMALRLELEEARTRADEYLDDLRRERAAFQNYKKRQQSERAELQQIAVSGLVVQILPILDDLERALEAVPEEQVDEPWFAGIRLIQRKLQATLEVTGVEPVEAEPGQLFDPFFHEAVTYEEDEDRQEGEIIAVVQKGYKINHRTLRPAMVRVAK
jgi:molecular chaperone GrpE